MVYRILLPVFVFFFFSSTVAQPPSSDALPKYLVGLGEYQCFIINTATSKLYGVSSSLVTAGVNWDAGVPGLPILVGVPPDHSFVDVASGLHNSLAADRNGEVWTWGANGVGESGIGSLADNGLAPVKVPADSLGNPFKGIVQVACWASGGSSGNIAVKSDGTVWIWGQTTEGMRGNGQAGQINTRPVQVNMPRGKKIVKVVAGCVVIALASDGTVWTWGGNNRKELLGTNTADYTHPHQLPLPQKAKDIAGGSFFSYALGVNGKLYGWGYHTAYMCIGKGGWAHQEPPPTVPRDLTYDLNLPHPIASIVTNSVSTHVILTDGTLWGWGDNSSGCVGNGHELDYARHKPPYAWDWSPGEMLVEKPVHLARGVNDFIRVFGGSCAVFYCYAETASGQLYSWGRNKGSVLGNGVVCNSSDILAAYPNSWDITTVTAVDPFALTGNKIVTSPFCLLYPDSSPCNQYKVPGKGTQ
jgi:alpha-tubulin suppressor-like RCC1 family protein